MRYENKSQRILLECKNEAASKTQSINLHMETTQVLKARALIF